jgi:L-fuconolactonase
MGLVVDAHQHFWQRSQRGFNYGWLDAPRMKPIAGDFLPRDLEPLLKKVGVDYSVFVQTQHNAAENDWVLGLADAHPFLAGVVGWVDLASPRCEEQLVDFRKHRKAVGIRHVVHDEPDDDWIVRDDVLRGLGVLERHGVPFDLLFFPRHLRHAATLARKFPGLPLVIDHLAKPRIKEGRMEGWLEDLRAAAAFPNVYCKLSGMVNEADWRGWTAGDLRPYVQTALEFFGPGRCMYGSDWPVSAAVAGYERVFHGLVEALGPIGEGERGQIFGGTAIEFYRLPVGEDFPAAKP